MQSFSKLIVSPRNILVAVFVWLLVSPVLGAPLFSETRNITRCCSEHFNTSSLSCTHGDAASNETTPVLNHENETESHSPSINLQSRDIVRKRMLSWDASNSLHDTGNLDYINQINWQFIPSYHNWHGWHPADMWIKGQEHIQDHVPQRPIIHDEPELSGEMWSQVLNTKADIIGFFNEPERTPGMTPEKAAQLWMDKMVPLRREKGKKLMSPGCADSGLDFCDRFIEIVTKQGEAPDYQAVHFYASGPGSSDAAIAYLKERHAKHPSMDIFVLKIASIDRDKNEVYKFTADVTNWMDGTSWIKEYAWFGFMCNLADGLLVRRRSCWGRVES